MAYPDEKPSGMYALRDYNFAVNDADKLPIDEYLFKNGYKNADESEIYSVPDAHNVNWYYDVLQRNLRYTLDTAEENKYLLANKVATPTSIGQVKIGYGLEVTEGGVISVSKRIAENAQIISYDLPVGSYMLWSGKNTPEYFIEPQGQTLLRSEYPELWQFAQDNELVGKLFGEGDGSTTFTETDIRDSFIKITNSDANTGVHTNAGLPDIYGYLGDVVSSTSSGANGAFNWWNTGAVTSGLDNTVQPLMASDFLASRSNPIYGNSNTVTPDNWGLKIILKALPTPPSTAVPTGTILDYTGLNAPDGYLIANGAEISRSTFSQLYQWAVANGLIIPQSNIPTTAHGYFGSGNGSTTFTIPDLRGVFKRSADLASNRGGSDTRAYQDSGAPNITGNIGFSGTDPTTAVAWGNGAFSRALWAGAGNSHDYPRDNAGVEYNFDASRSSAVYGRSGDVRPRSVSTIPILKY